MGPSPYINYNGSLKTEYYLLRKWKRTKRDELASGDIKLTKHRYHRGVSWEIKLRKE